MATYLERVQAKNRRRKAQQALAAATPEQLEAERGLLDELYGGALTGVSYAGNVLDTPGNWAREALAGNNPFGHTLDPSKRVRGKDLWRQWTGEDPGFWGGFAVEVLTDPLTYMTGGLSAMGKLGKVAKGAGVISKSDDLVRIAGKKALKFKEASDLGKLDDVARTALDRKHASRLVGIGEEMAGGGVGIGPRRAKSVLSPRDLITYADDPDIARAAFDQAMDAHAIKKKMGKNWRPSWFKEQMDRRLGHHLRMDIPFTKKGFGVPDWIPTGKYHLAGFEGLGLDRLGQKMRWGPLGRLGAVGFDASVRGARGKEFQQAAQKLTRGQEASRLKARQFVAEQATAASKLSKQASDPEAMRRYFETGANPSALFSNADQKTLAELRQQFGSSFDDSLRRAQELGIPTEHLTDPAGISYFPRFAVGGTPLGSRPGALFDAADPSSLKRNPILKGLSGGTETLRSIINDTALNPIVERIRNLKKFPHLKAGTEALEIKKLTKDLHTTMQKKYGNLLVNPDYVSKKSLDMIAAGTTPGVVSDQVKGLSNWMIGLEPEARRMGVFANHPFADAAIRLTRAEDSIAAAELVLGKVTEHGVHIAQGGATLPYGVPLKKVLADMKLVASVGDEIPAHIQRLADDFASAGKGLGGDAASILDEFVVPREVYEELTRVNDFYKVPGLVSGMKKGFDGFLTLTKAHLTTPFAAFAGRNFMSGQFRNYAIGLHSLKSMKQAHNLLVGKVVKGSKDMPMVKQMLAERGITATDKSATDLLREIVYKHDLVPASSYGVDPVSARALGTGMPAQGLPGFEPIQSPFRGGLVGKWLGFGKDVTRNPFDVAGAVKFRAGKGLKGKLPWKWSPEEVFQTKFGPVAAGVELNMWVEGMNRVSPLIEGLTKGQGDDAVAELIKRAQVDYANRKFSSFEREWLQRIFPFFKFRMGQFKFLPGHMASKPGGPITQVMRASRLARGDEYMPEHVAETAAMQVPGKTPLSPSDPETLRYLTGLGFMFEDPLAFAANPLSKHGWETGVLELLSSMRPEIKAPLEFGARQSFFQRGPSGGRPMKEIGSPIGQIMENLSGVPLEERDYHRGGPAMWEQALMNSPFSRYITTARQLTSPAPRALRGQYSDAAKAAFNVLTGLRFTDVTRPQQQGIIRQRAEAAIEKLPSRVGREFLQTYVPKRSIVGLVEEGKVREAAQAESLNLLLRRLRSESRTRAKGKKERRLGKEGVVRQDAEINAIIEMLRKQLPVTELYKR